MNSYDLAEKIVNKILRNMSPERCTWGEKYWEAYKDLHNFRADMIQDAKSEIEKAGASSPSEWENDKGPIDNLKKLAYKYFSNTVK